MAAGDTGTVIVGGIEVARGIYTLLIKPAQSKPITVK